MPDSLFNQAHSESIYGQQIQLSLMLGKLRHHIGYCFPLESQQLPMSSFNSIGILLHEGNFSAEIQAGWFLRCHHSSISALLTRVSSSRDPSLQVQTSQTLTITTDVVTLRTHIIRMKHVSLFHFQTK